jgi:DNA processing protein
MDRAWLILADAPNMDGAGLAPLLERFGGAGNLIAAKPGELSAAGVTDAVAGALRNPDESRIGAGLAWLAAAPDHHLVSWEDPRYPSLLKQIQHPPVALFVRGDPACLALPQLAIVGSRNATPAGRDTARDFAAHLARCGLAITSGLALGIDAAAHEGALGCGRTVAVLGTGPDEIYPHRHAGLATAIAAHGALCTEFMPGMPALRTNFPRRNRIISGLAVGTLVVEAGLQSGALITARFAAEQGREVFAIPGSIHNPLAKGCHHLIREGAKLVESADHILVELAELLGVPEQPQGTQRATPSEAKSDFASDPDYARLLEAIGWDTADIDTLVTRSGLTAAEVSSMLLILELQGSVQLLAGGRYQRQR